VVHASSLIIIISLIILPLMGMHYFWCVARLVSKISSAAVDEMRAATSSNFVKKSLSVSQWIPPGIFPRFPRLASHLFNLATKLFVRPVLVFPPRIAPQICPLILTITHIYRLFYLKNRGPPNNGCGQADPCTFFGLTFHTHTYTHRLLTYLECGVPIQGMIQRVLNIPKSRSFFLFGA
jgi:hypothetical protein